MLPYKIYHIYVKKEQINMLYDFLDIDKNSNVLLYEQLYHLIIRAVNENKLRKGDKLPSIRRLADDLSVSRTTVQTAYDQLCAEGYITALPQKGYFIEANKAYEKLITLTENQTQANHCQNNFTALSAKTKIKYDFSGSGIDPQYIDIKFWSRCVKNILEQSDVISSYGLPQGETELRTVLCDYARNVRGVDADVDRIVIGAGTQPLLSILLGLCKNYGKDIALEKGFFPQGEQVFSDFGFDFTKLSADKNGIILNSNIKSRLLFVNSSGSIRGSAPIPINKRIEMINWAEKNDAIIIEDDFNGELRYSSKPVPALQGMNSDKVVYIGSFSKLLLPSIRISYMVLPKKLAEIYSLRKQYYNQTSSKVEQLALAEYIQSGRLERQLRKLRKIYAVKSQILYDCLFQKIGHDAIIDVIETALCVRIKFQCSLTLDGIKKIAQENSIKLGKCRNKNNFTYIYLCFAGIETEKIHSAADLLCKILKPVLNPLSAI